MRKVWKGSYREGTPRCGVYGLRDPRTRVVRYVGSSVHMDARYGHHVNGADTNRRKKEWIFELRRAGLKPELVVLHECNEADLKAIESTELTTRLARGECDLNVHRAQGPKGRLAEENRRLLAENSALKTAIRDLCVIYCK